jgi:hypothetical protein
MKWESDICEPNGSNVTRLGPIEDGYKRSTIHVVRDRPYMGIPQWWRLYS